MKKIRPILSAALCGVFLFAFLLLNCSDKNNSLTNPLGPTANNEIWMQMPSFVPASITVEPGTTVTWLNKDDYSIGIGSGTPDNPDGLFSDENLSKGSSFSYTFTQEGTYPFFCKSHPEMVGTVIVKMSSSSGGGY